MTDANVINKTATALGLTLADVRSLDGSFSGSQVFPATTSQGSEVILKITVDADSGAWPGSLRELGFYRDLAAQVAVRTPRLLDHRVTDDLVALVISRHPAPVRASDWTTGDWLQLASDLAKIHRTDLPGDATVRRPPTGLDDRVLAFWSDAGRRIDELLHDPEPLLRQATALDACFVHGDCHVDNISRDENGLVWLDWQGCGVANPAGDLAFPSVRAAPAGVRVPLPDMIRVYATQRGLDADLVLHAARAQELLVLLFQWPEYAGLNSEIGNVRQRERVSALVGETFA